MTLTKLTFSKVTNSQGQPGEQNQDLILRIPVAVTQRHQHHLLQQKHQDRHDDLNLQQRNLILHLLADVVIGEVSKFKCPLL